LLKWVMYTHFSILVHINWVQILTLNRHIRTQKIKGVNPGKQIHMYTVSNWQTLTWTYTCFSIATTQNLPFGNIMPLDQLIRWWTTKETIKVKGVKHFKQFVKGVIFGCSVFMEKFDIQVVNSIKKNENPGKEPSYISTNNHILLHI
jgi:hypothetical protein